MKRKKMKINGLFIFSLVIGTFSLSLNRNKIQADLTEDATTLPAVDIAKHNTGVYTDSDFTVYSIETTIQTPHTGEDEKEQNVSHSEQEPVYSKLYENNLQQNYKSEDELTDFNVITTVRPQLHPSYFVQFRARRNAECNSEVNNENANCTEKIEETNDNENAKENDSESESFTENSLGDIIVYEETTDSPQYKNIQEKFIDDTQIESNGQDTDSRAQLPLDLESILLNRRITKRDTSKEVEMPIFLEETQTTMSPIDVDYTENDYYEFANAVEKPSLAVRLLYKIGYLYYLIEDGTINFDKLFTDLNNALTNYLNM